MNKKEGKAILKTPKLKVALQNLKEELSEYPEDVYLLDNFLIIDLDRVKCP